MRSNTLPAKRPDGFESSRRSHLLAALDLAHSYFGFRMHTAYGRVASLSALRSTAWSGDEVTSITVVSKCRVSLARRAKSVHDLTGVDLPGVNGFFMASKVSGLRPWEKERFRAFRGDGDAGCSLDRGDDALGDFGDVARVPAPDDDEVVVR